jgi:hypothetical protein
MMHCMACNADMIVIAVVKDDTMPIPGFEWHTFKCSACDDVERRLVFSNPDTEVATPMHAAPSIVDEHGGNEPLTLMDRAPSIAQASARQDALTITSGLLRRAVAKIRSW